MGALEDRMEKLEERSDRKAQQHIDITGQDITLYGFAGERPTRLYSPSPTGASFHEDKTSFVRLVMGPFGSGKTTMCLMDIVRRACEMPKCVDGIRRSRVAIIRNTAPQLEASTFRSWKLWFEKLGVIRQRKKPIFVLMHTFNDGHGEIELEVEFIACDKEQHLGKFKSTEYTMAYVNEASELPRGILSFMKGRVNGRYPDKQMVNYQPYWSGIILDTNPPKRDHWIHEIFELEQPPLYRIFKQPSGLLLDDDNNLVRDGENLCIENPGADNLKFLDDTYYTHQAIGEDEEYIKVFCCGLYGILKCGKPVYPEYNDDVHSVGSLDLLPNQLLRLGWDFGLTPACLISQFVDGQLRCIKEFTSSDCTLEDLILNAVLPWLNVNARDMPFISVGDPADSKLVHYFETLEKHGLQTDPGLTNKIEARLDAVKGLLNRLVGGEAALMISREGCPVLREGFIQTYHYRRVNVLNEERYREIPNKTHPVSDIHDGLQYIAMQIGADYAQIEPIDHSQFLDTHIPL